MAFYSEKLTRHTFEQTRDVWSKYLAQTGFRTQLMVSIVVLVLALLSISQFLIYAESRDGSVILDPILSLFHPKDFTWTIFTLLYGSLISTLVYFFMFYPNLVLIGLQTYSLMVFLRIFAMYLIPLEAPATTIVLLDPFVQFWTNASAPFTKDLFFSGHTATYFILYFLMPVSPFKKALLMGAFVMGALLVMQHVHYTIDILAAPFFSYAAYRTSLFLQKAMIDTRLK